ncbi:MAG: hypothetical protein MI920_17315 [Kiloniellales bacterium]|nr:hypothetical protein [Kiloniellales bacterium]
MARRLSDSPAAIRIRRYRERRREGRVVALCEVEAEEVEALIAAGYLSPEDEDDREAIGRALLQRYRECNA